VGTTRGNLGTYDYPSRYGGTTNATMTTPPFPFSTPWTRWESAGDVEFEIDSSLSSIYADVYTTLQGGSVSITAYTDPDGAGSCYGVPATIVRECTVKERDGYLTAYILKDGTLEYRAEATSACSTVPYQECCPSTPVPACTSRTMDFSGHGWLYTSGAKERTLYPASTDGMLEGSWSPPPPIPPTYEWDASFEWHLVQVEE
jgi:hypothetical protein